MRALLLLALLSIGSAAADDTEAFFEAARTGEVAKVKELLAKGVDVNAKWRYDTTALHMAARRGHTDVVRALLEAGADCNVKDSFYGMSVLDGALGSGKVEIVRMLLDKGVRGKGQALLYSVSTNKPELVKLILAQGGLDSESLSIALGQASKANRTEIADMLKAAGAVPPPVPAFQVDAETLQRYAGTYRDERENELVMALKDGRLVGSSFGRSYTLGAFDKVTFQPGDQYGVRVIFQLDGEKVTGLQMKQGETIQRYRRVETK